MILGLDYGDPERIGIIVLVLISLYQMWKGDVYDRYLKVILTVPRIYIIFYYVFVVLNLHIGTILEHAVLAGIFSLYGLLMLFGVEVYVRWVSRKYGRR